MRDGIHTLRLGMERVHIETVIPFPFYPPSLSCLSVKSRRLQKAVLSRLPEQAVCKGYKTLTVRMRSCSEVAGPMCNFKFNNRNYCHVHMFKKKKKHSDRFYSWNYWITCIQCGTHPLFMAFATEKRASSYKTSRTPVLAYITPANLTHNLKRQGWKSIEKATT